MSEKGPDWVEEVRDQIRQADAKMLSGDKTVAQKMVDLMPDDMKQNILNWRPKKLISRSLYKTRVSEKFREQMVEIIKAEKSP